MWSGIYNCVYLYTSQFLCPEAKQRLLEARLEALSFGSIECFNELGQVQPVWMKYVKQYSTSIDGIILKVHF